MLFDIPKYARKIEKLQLKSIHKLEIAFALYMVVANRITRLMRECPELEAALVSDPDELKTAYTYRTKKSRRTYYRR